MIHGARSIRISFLLILLGGVGFWGFLQWQADNHVFAWERPVSGLIVCVSDPHADPTEDVLRGFFARFLSTGPAFESNLSGISKWFAREFETHMGHPMQPVQFSARGPIQASAAPPLPPTSDAPFLDRWRGTRKFLGYFQDLARRANLVTESYDAVVFVYFYGEDDVGMYAGQHSIASRRDRLGVVFSAVGPSHFRRCAALVAHELCHALGATDKYEGERSIFPDGFAEPEKSPRFPQTLCEIMSLAIPLSESSERHVETLTDCVVGKKTAQEIGWIR